MYLAVCSDIASFKNDKLRDRQWSSRFPGSGWITCLYDLAAESNMEVSSGDVAIANIASKKWDAKDVYIIQDMTSSEAARLLDMGGRPFLITCFEGPLYAPVFHDSIAHVAKAFQFSLGFGFSDDQRVEDGRTTNLPFRFPSYYLDDVQAIRPWGSRRKMVLVAANKYKTNRVFIPGKLTIANVLAQLKSLGRQFISPAYRNALAASLHGVRLEAIKHFVSRKELWLYGAGWNRWDGLPAAWGTVLRDLVNGQYLGQCPNKLEVLSGYRFSICFENMVLPGYVTEKIVDCFVAGTVPLYCGAPDIEMFVPAGSFVDIRAYNSFDQVDGCLDSMNECDAMRIICAGREYLKTEIGMLHSYEGFARNVIRLATSC